MRIFEFCSNIGTKVTHAVPANKINLVRLFHEETRHASYIDIYVEGKEFTIHYDSQEDAKKEYDRMMKVLSEL